ncbi:uncharacterized protein BX664DRAFT_249573, partial [Halteromyces radiatus]|uniref:uncharacterized protein n=1 Tax=Halteromyces radiatus TaxID=101107 RepID=UPI002220D436
CDICNSGFGRLQELKRHIRSTHKKERPYACPRLGCNATFKRKDVLKRHLRSVKNH